ncbi:MAG: polyprenyl synthetase family protein [Planctomycetota bacterium]
MPDPALNEFWRGLDDLRRMVERRLDVWLPAADEPPERLHAAMRYSLFAGGKRVRPILCLLACRAVGGADEQALPPACAIECVHTYSLIHDDLPAMDDDDVRRGKPSCHRKFDAATAILAGDALLTLAFGIVAEQTPDPEVARLLTAEIAAAAGWAGMVGGQMADLLAEGAGPDEEALHFIHERKTGALIRASVRTGALAGGAGKAELAALSAYACRVGLAFQIADDILDETATTEKLGKTAGKDKDAGKLTFPAVYGLDESRARGRRIADEAKRAVAGLGRAAEPLQDLAEFIVARTA